MENMALMKLINILELILKHYVAIVSHLMLKITIF